MHADLNVQHHRKKFQKIIIIFAFCTKITSSRGPKRQILKRTNMPFLFFFTGHTVLNYLLQIYQLRTHVDYYICDFLNNFFDK